MQNKFKYFVVIYLMGQNNDRLAYCNDLRIIYIMSVLSVILTDFMYWNIP